MCQGGKGRSIFSKGTKKRHVFKEPWTESLVCDSLEKRIVADPLLVPNIRSRVRVRKQGRQLKTGRPRLSLDLLQATGPCL